LVRGFFLLATYQNNDQVPYFEDVGIAINLLEGRGYSYNFSRIDSNVSTRPTAVKPPLYPLLLSVIFFCFGMKNFLALFIVHTFLSSLTCLMLFLSIKMFSYNTAVVASLSVAMYLPFIYHTVTVPESTTLLLFLITIFCYELSMLHKNFSQKRWILASIVAGILIMTEPITLPFIFITFFYMIFLKIGEWKNALGQLSLTIILCTVIISPWIIRNYYTFQKSFLLKSSFGGSLKDSLANSGVKLPREVLSNLQREVKGLDEVSEDKLLIKAILSWLFTEPFAYIKLLPKNFFHFWWEVTAYRMNYSKGYIIGRKIPYTLLLLLALPSLTWRLLQLLLETRESLAKNIYQNIMIALILSYTVVYTALGAWLLRYHFPVELALFVFFSEGVLFVSHKALRLQKSFTLYRNESVHAHHSGFSGR
jgi:4-amino-4-deoxy-L-arabinose transferase-like glycosyltransferase